MTENSLKFTKDQIAVGVALVKSSKTLKQLVEELDLGPNRIRKALNGMKKLGVVREVNGRYSLIPEARLKLMGREPVEEKLPFKLHAIIEGQSKDKKILAKANDVLLEELKKDKLIRATNFVVEDIVKEGSYYYVMFECDVYAKNFEDLVYFVLHYGPSVIELEEPAKFELTRHEGQGVLLDVSSTLHYYMGLIAKLKAEREIVIK